MDKSILDAPWFIALMMIFWGLLVAPLLATILGGGTWNYWWSIPIMVAVPFTNGALAWLFITGCFIFGAI